MISWLTNSLIKDIARSVEYSELAKDIWGELEEKYGKADDARIFELNKELAHISQGSSDIASYFNRIKNCGMRLPLFLVISLLYAHVGEQKG